MKLQSGRECFRIRASLFSDSQCRSAAHRFGLINLRERVIAER
jgi:hypothetical protein